MSLKASLNEIQRFKNPWLKKGNMVCIDDVFELLMCGDDDMNQDDMLHCLDASLGFSSSFNYTECFLSRRLSDFSPLQVSESLDWKYHSR